MLQNQSKSTQTISCCPSPSSSFSSPFPLQHITSSLNLVDPNTITNSQWQCFHSILRVSTSQVPTTASSLFSAYASLNAFIMLVRSMLDHLIPYELRCYIYSAFGRLFTFRSSDLTLIVDDNCGMVQNEIYEAAEVYLRTKISPQNDRLRVRKAPRHKNISVTVEKDEVIKDSFEGMKINWRFVCSGGENEQNNLGQQKRQYELTVSKKHTVKMIESYLPYVLDRAEAIKNKDKVVKLYSQEGHYDPYDDESNSDWSSTNLEHPANFETLAMDPEVKRTIIEDLDRFLRRREFYKKVGKAWKRGYLLYGPPGTGKSSLIAAMANYLKFDIYDVELTSIQDNSELRRILLSTTNRSILVIEDIDYSVEIQNRKCEEEDCKYKDVGSPPYGPKHSDVVVESQHKYK